MSPRKRETEKESLQRTVDSLKSMSADEIFQLSVRAGVHNPDGTLTPEYGGDASVTAKKPRKKRSPRQSTKPSSPAAKPKRKRRKSRRAKRGFHSSEKLTNGPAHFRSGWEHLYMLWLDTNEDVNSYEYEPFEIVYAVKKRTGRGRKYIPDVMVHYVDGHDELVEIKPLKRTTGITVMKKAIAAREWCAAHGAVYVMVTEVELKLLSIL